MKILFLSFLLAVSFDLAAQSANQKITAAANSLEQKAIGWRRDFHANPELGNREFRTADIVAKHLRALNIEVTTGVGKTGVVGILKGSLPGPVIALRADMDALPITERNDLPFASKIKTNYNGVETGVMHACGHDAHTAILMGVAEILAGMRKELKGTIKFIFQPAEEGAPLGEEGGAKLMVKEGVMTNPAVNVIFGLHVDAEMPVGIIGYKPGGIMASACDMKITVNGKGAHGAFPWLGVDPIVTAAEIVTSLQTIVSRNVNLNQNSAVVSVGSINGGNRFNVIPEKVEMTGTVRTFTEADQKLIFEKIRLIAENIAAANGATAEVLVPYSVQYPVTFNDSNLVTKSLPTLQRVAGAANVRLLPGRTISEDFSFYQQKVPGMYFFVGAKPTDGQPKSHHTADFFLDEGCIRNGMIAMANLVVDYQRGF